MDLKLKSLRKTKKEIVTPPRVGEIIEGKILAEAKNSLFLDLGPKGVGIIYGQELNRAKDYLKNLKPEDKVLAKVINIENEEGYRELSVVEASKEFTWKSLEEKKEKDEMVEAKVKKANKGGLIFEINGIPGFLPASQLNHEHYPKVKDGDVTEIAKILQKFVGTTFKVKIMDLDPRKEKLILTEKTVKHEPRKDQKEALQEYKVGDKVKGEIAGITNFGAFVKLEENTEGLLQKSEISSKKTDDITKIIKIGQKVEAKIINISNNRIYLSLKK